MTSGQRKNAACSERIKQLVRLGSFDSLIALRRSGAVLACIGACLFWAYEPAHEQARASPNAPVLSPALPPGFLQLIDQTEEDSSATATEQSSGQGDQPAKAPSASDRPSNAALFVLRHQGPVTRVAFEPSGERLVTAARDGTARIWDARTGEPIGKPLQARVIVYAAV